MLEQNSMLRMQEMAFPGFKFQKFSRVACLQNPLDVLVPPNSRIMLQSDFWLDPPLSAGLPIVKSGPWDRDDPRNNYNSDIDY